MSDSQDRMSQEIQEAIEHEREAEALEMAMLGQTGAAREGEPVYEYSVRLRGRKKGSTPYPVRDTVEEIERLYGSGQPRTVRGDWVLVRRVKSEWEDVP